MKSPHKPASLGSLSDFSARGEDTGAHTGRMQALLDRLAAEDNVRILRDVHTAGKFLADESGKQYVNLSSNDYLGLADPALQRAFFEELTAGASRHTEIAFALEAAGAMSAETGAAAAEKNIRTGQSAAGLPATGYPAAEPGVAVSGRFILGNPASRLMTGNSSDYGRLESSLAALWPGRTALVLGSGYLTNVGVLPALTGKGDLILGDKLLHASVIDGLRIGDAEWQRFRHNDMDHLETLLRRASGRYRTVWVATESVFSMDGDRAPLRELAALKERYGFSIYLDEAHAFGVFGPGGAGCAAGAGVAGQIDVLAGTLGKALASYGAFVVTDETIRRVLVNRMRTLIFSTALPPVSLLWSDFLVRRLEQFDDRRAHLQKLIALLSSDRQATQIIPIRAGGNRRALDMAERFREAGFWTTAIRHPTVPRGEARVRISLTAALTADDIKRFHDAWKQLG